VRKRKVETVQSDIVGNNPRSKLPFCGIGNDRNYEFKEGNCALKWSQNNGEQNILYQQDCIINVIVFFYGINKYI